MISDFFNLFNLFVQYSEKQAIFVGTFEVGGLVLLISIPNQKIVLCFKYIEKFLHLYFFSGYFCFDFEITGEKFIYYNIS